MMAAADSLRPVRMIDAHDEALAAEARTALDRDVTRVRGAMVTAAQRSLILSEAGTILRRLTGAEAEATREREETAALAAERNRYARVAEALAQTPQATAEDAREIEMAVARADRMLAALHEADMRTAEWLDAVRDSVTGLCDTLACATASADAAPTPPVLRSLSRMGAMLGTMLRAAETQRDRTREALSAARAWPFVGVERNPVVAAAVARAEQEEQRTSGRR